MTPILQVQGLSAWYGPIRALFELDLVIAQGGVTALLGANGAGKTTTLRAVCNMIRRAGVTKLAGTDISRRGTEDIVRVVREEFGKGNDFCQKITSKSTGKKPDELLSEFRNSYFPRIAVTVVRATPRNSATLCCVSLRIFRAFCSRSPSWRGSISFNC